MRLTQQQLHLIANQENLNINSIPLNSEKPQPEILTKILASLKISLIDNIPNSENFKKITFCDYKISKDFNCCFGLAMRFHQIHFGPGPN